MKSIEYVYFFPLISNAELSPGGSGNSSSGGGGGGGGPARSRDRNERGETAMHVAAIKGDQDGIKKLLEQGMSPNVADFAGNFGSFVKNTMKLSSI